LEVARWLLAQDDRLRAAAQQYAEAAVAFGTVHWAVPGTTAWGGPEQAAKRAAALAAMRDRALDDLARRLAGPILRAAARTRPPETDGTAGPAEASRSDAGPPTAPPPPAAVPMGPVSSLLHELHWALQRAAWEGRRTAYQLAEAQWRRQQAELAKARTMGVHITR
jgi:hypothetical protein